MSVRALKTLLWIRDGRSFQEAARELNMTLSAVSMQMKQLEETYQVALFDRSTRPPRLTREGLTLADASRDIVTAYEDLPIVLRNSQPLSGKLALGVIATASIRLLPAVAQHLMTAFPQLKLRVESALSIDLVDRVADGRLDAAVVTGTEDLGNAFAVTPILVEPFVLVAAKSERGQLSINLLRTRPFIRFAPRTGIGQLVDAFLADRSIEIREGMVLDSLEAIVELVALNMGVTIIPEPEARRYGQGRVVWTESLGRPLNRTLALITRRTSGSLVLHDPLVAAFRQVVSRNHAAARRGPAAKKKAGK
jgi:DNA-binding transcriptional LysR family regulator